MLIIHLLDLIINEENFAENNSIEIEDFEVRYDEHFDGSIKENNLKVKRQKEILRINNPAMVNVDEFEHLPSDYVVDGYSTVVLMVQHSMVIVVVVPNHRFEYI